MEISKARILTIFMSVVMCIILLANLAPRLSSVQDDRQIVYEPTEAKVEKLRVSSPLTTSAIWNARGNISRELLATTCHGHVELCYLRELLERTSGEKLNDDHYDMSPLYKFKTHMFLDHPDLHLPDWHGKIPGPKLRQAGRGMREFIDYEALLIGNKKLSLNLPKDTDINRRTCDYDPYKEYKYSYQAYHNSGAVHVYVIEVPLEKSILGGKREMNDIFGNVATTSTKRLCMLLDFFSNNDTYHIACPILEPEFEITIQANYISITSLDVNCKTLNAKHLIWNLKIYKQTDFSANENTLLAIQRPNKSVHTLARYQGRLWGTTGDCKDGRGHKSGFWLKISSIFYWTSKSCHYSYKISSSKLSCLKSKNTIMFGDSHMQNRCDAIHQTYQLGNFRYYFTLHAIHLVTNLLDVYEETLNGKLSPDVLVMNAGVHDLRDLTVTTYIATFEDVFTMIRKFKALQKPPKILWIETTPVTYNGFHGRHMTNLIVKGANDWIDHQMYILGVEILYSHDIASPMLSEHRGYGMHFYHFLGNNVKRGQKVNVGGATTSILLNMICPGA